MAATPRKPQKPLALGKLYASCIRTAAVPALVAESGGVQFGAIPGDGPDLPSICTQMLRDGAARHGKTVAVVFADVKRLSTTSCRKSPWAP